MNMNMTTKLEGFYSIKVHGGKRGEIDFGTHKNMILDAGITHMLNGNYPLEYIHIGSGSSQPNPRQVQLDAKFAHTNRSKNFKDGYVSAEDSESGRAYGYGRITVQFDKGAAKGNIAELGVGNNTQGNPLWSRSLVLDKTGNPTTITVLEDEFLTVTYEVRRYVNTETVMTTLQYDDDGEMKSVECSIVPSSDKSSVGWGSAGLTITSRAFPPLYNPSSSNGFKKIVDGSRASFFIKYGIGEGNNQDISSPHTDEMHPLIPIKTKLLFNPPLRKTNEFELTIGITVTIERA